MPFSDSVHDAVDAIIKEMAEYQVNDPAEVKELLEMLADLHIWASRRGGTANESITPKAYRAHVKKFLMERIVDALFGLSDSESD